jgi:phosphatidylglycerol:prolipoprotein diacylglycerol transferase
MYSEIFSFILWDITPTIVDILGREVRWYGLFFALGFLIGQQILIRIYKGEGRAEKDVETLTIYMVIATVVGARLGHVLFYQPDYYLENPLEILQIWQGGLASHGATIGILVAIYLYSKKATNQSYFYVLDRLVIVIALAGCFIRLGNLMNSEIIGLPTNSPTAFVFVREAQDGLQDIFDKQVEEVKIAKSDSNTTIENFQYQGLNILVNFKAGVTNKDALVNEIIDQVQGSSYFTENIMIPYKAGYKIEGNKATIHALGIPRHPSQLYEAISCFIIFILLGVLYMQKRGNIPEGRLFSIFVIMIFGLRFIYEFYKEDQVAFEQGLALNMGQILSIPLIIAGIFILMRSFKKKDEII